MAVLYVDEYGCTLRALEGRLVAEKNGVELASVRVQELEAVVIRENCAITSSAVSEMLDNGIDVAFINRRNEYAGRLETPPGKNLPLRRQQYKLADDDAFCLSVAKRFVAAKLANMSAIALRYGRSDEEPALTQYAAHLREAAKAAGIADSMQELLGIEGAGSRHYFAAVARIVRPPFVFEGRNRRPPQDPVNAMLGFAYALLENAIDTTLAIVGLDPFCGFYHRDVYGRHGLALDIMEEFRPVVADSVVFNICRRGILDPVSHFESRDGGVYLNEEGRQRFFCAFHARLKQCVKVHPDAEPTDYRSVFLNQSRLIAQCVRQGRPNYIPFRIR